VRGIIESAFTCQFDCESLSWFQIDAENVPNGVGVLDVGQTAEWKRAGIGGLSVIEVVDRLVERLNHRTPPLFGRLRQTLGRHLAAGQLLDDSAPSVLVAYERFFGGQFGEVDPHRLHFGAMTSDAELLEERAKRKLGCSVDRHTADS